MKHIALIAVLVLTCSAPLFAAEEADESPLQLTVELTDGSRLIGTSKLSSLPVRSEALGKIEIPLAKIRTVKFSHDHESVAVTMTNGDSVRGGLGDLSLQLRTSFGDITVPVEHVTTISISVAATDRTRFSAAGDFSAESNPNGVWSYGWCDKYGGEFRLYTDKVTNHPLTELRGWRSKGGPGAVFNTSKQVLYPDNKSVAIQPGQLSFHPGPNGEYSMIRWIAPQSGRFEIAGAFTGLSGYNGWPPTTTDVHVLYNSASVFDSFINVQDRGNEAPFKIEKSVRQGDTIDFVVGYGNGNYNCDTTGLEAVITSSPQSKENHP
jgi:hypothetical protein